MRHLLAAVLAICALTMLPLSISAPAQADAQNGVCAKGYRLAHYTDHKDAYNVPGQHMWRVTYSKRWCYDYAKHRVGSVYVSWYVKFYGVYGMSWKWVSGPKADAYYSSRNARGQATRYKQFSHFSTKSIRLQHCTVFHKVCPHDTYVKMGIYAYSDGSKKVVP